MTQNLLVETGSPDHVKLLIMLLKWVACFGVWLFIMLRFWLLQENLAGKTVTSKVKTLSFFALKGVVAAIAIYILANVGDLQYLVFRAFGIGVK